MEFKSTGADIRKLFIPDPGYVFLEADLSQAEARVVALLAKDELLLKMFIFVMLINSKKL